MSSATVDPAALYADLVNDENIGTTSPLQHSAAATVSPFDAATSIATTLPMTASGAAVDVGSLAWANHVPGNGGSSLASFADNLQPLDTSPSLQQSWAFSPQLAGSQMGHQQAYPQSSTSTGIAPSSLYSQPGMPAPSLVRPQLPPEVFNVLTPAQQEKLRSIAMPSHLQFPSPQSISSPESAFGRNGKRSSSSPEAQEQPKRGVVRKRKSSSGSREEDEEDEEGSGDSQQPVKKTTHNMIEKRYRTNLNDKIAALRDSVPSLRIMSKSARGEDVTEDKEDLQGLTPAHKLNKATVLSKATEYIRHLEKRNGRLADENSAMQQRIAAFERLFMAGAMTGTISAMQHPSTSMALASEGQQPISTPVPTSAQVDPPVGMIPVPDDMRRILAQQIAAGQPYPIPQQPYHQNPAIIRQQRIQREQQMIQASRWLNAGPYAGKLMVGSLAGLLILEAVRENEQSNEKTDGRGLFAVPIQLLAHLTNSSHVTIAGYHFSAAQIIHAAKLLTILGLLLWFFIPSLFVQKHTRSQKTRLVNAALTAAPSPASPIHIRRQAWLTAVQTVWVPRHNFFLEAAALVLKTMKLSIRSAVGVEGYQMLTGLTEEQEKARVKAWTIALDAQLAGGDVEINKSRLTLTLLASGTLPDTPQRLMLKALHTRVLLWQPGRRGLQAPLVRAFAMEVANAKWNQAKQLERMLVQLRKGSSCAAAAEDELLPDHLAFLLQKDCQEVLSDDIVQRAYNLAWNHPTTQDAARTIDSMDAVVDDTAVRSPMDAVAAWYSCSVLHRVLAASLASEASADHDASPSSSDSQEDLLDLAGKVAPIGSDAQLRALVARAVLSPEQREASIAAAVQALRPPSSHDGGLPLSTTVRDPDAQLALQCAVILAHLEAPPRSSATSSTSSSSSSSHGDSLRPEVLLLIDAVVPALRGGTTTSMSLLGCAAAFRLMAALHGLRWGPAATAEACARPLERLAGSLRIWLGGGAGAKCGLDEEVRRAAVERCLNVTKAVVGMKRVDPGYGSMSDDDDENEDEGDNDDVGDDVVVVSQL